MRPVGEDRWHCDSCGQDVLVVARLHCDDCGEYHDVCLDCADRRRASATEPDLLDLREVSTTLLAGEGSSLGIFAVGSREGHLAQCVRPQ